MMELLLWIKPILFQTVTISVIILVLLIIVEFLALRFSGFVNRSFTKRRWIQYIVGAAAGSIPGCTGVFAIDAAYMAGIAGFGGIVAAMVATFGDEAFILLGQAAMPQSKIGWEILTTIFAILFILGILAGWLADKFAKITNMKFCKKCIIEKHSEIDTTTTRKIPVRHFINEHLWNHIVKKHIWQIVIWLFVSLIAVKALNQSFDLETITTQNRYILVLVAAVIGILPLSGPNVIFITLFVQGQLPFSVLLTNSIVQDGHGLLPVLGFSVDDAVKIKAFNFIFGLAIGYILLTFGI